MALGKAGSGSVRGPDFDLLVDAVVALQAAPALTVRAAAGVPTGAPTSAELPLAYDTTAVTGGFYFWNGSAWVKVATIL